MKVELTWGEMAIAGHAGVLRQINALAQRLHDPDAHHRDPMEAHVSGAISEYAVAKALGQRWEPTIGITWAGDVDGDVGAIEVRSTSLPQGSLILHDYSFDDRYYVLVLTGKAPVYEIVGGGLARELKQSRWRRTNVPRPAYFVPQGALRPMNELLEEAGIQAAPSRRKEEVAA